MDAFSWDRVAADAVLALHAAIVFFVIIGPVCVVAGNLRGWGWVNAPPFRAAHAAAIFIVVAESWAGLDCPLTILEMRLRERAGIASYSGSFVEYWLQRFLYHDFPAWVFTLAYTAFGLIVLAVWLRYPPVFRDRRRQS